MPTVRFMPAGITAEVEEGSFLIDAALAAGLPVWQQCGNNAICGWCKMQILGGAENLSAPEEPELLLFEREHFPADTRASCQSAVYGDVCVTTSYW